MNLIILAFCLILSSCAMPETTESGIKGYSRLIWDSERLTFEGYRTGYEGELILLYSSDKRIGVDEARRLLVASVARLLDRLNEDAPFPYRVEDITFGIQFKDEEGKFVEEGYVAEATLRDEELSYYVWDAEQKKRVKVFKEYFTEAYGRAFGRGLGKGVAPFRR